MSVDLANSDKLLTTTRGVRRRLDFDRPVERSVIEECVDVALQAPTGGDLFNVEFVVVTDPDIRKRMGEIYCDAHLPYLDELQATEMKNLSGEETARVGRQFDTYRWQTENVHLAPVHVHVGGNGRYEKQEMFMQASFYGCVLPPAWSFMLALRARGVGSLWTTVHLQEPYQERARKLLGLPKDYTQAVFLPCGYYKGKDFKPATRPPGTQRTHWETW